MLGVSDPKLIPILSRVEKPIGENKKVVMVLPSFLNAKGITKSAKDVLVLILKGEKLITMYYCSQPNYLFRKEKDSEFQIIY